MISCHFKQYCSEIYSRTGVNCYWIIHDSQQVLSTLNTINYFSTARLLTVMISLCCTQVFHMYLSNMPWPLSSKKLTVRDNIFLVVGKAHWSDKPSSRHSFTEETLITYVVDNIYVCIGNRIYGQAFLWAQIVHLHWPACSCFIMRTIT